MWVRDGVSVDGPDNGCGGGGETGALAWPLNIAEPNTGKMSNIISGKNVYSALLKNWVRVNGQSVLRNSDIPDETSLKLSKVLLKYRKIKKVGHFALNGKLNRD